MGNKTSIHVTKHPSLREGLGGLLLFLLFSLFAVSCSESDDESAEEFSDWQVRNDAYFATLEDSLSRDAAHWQKIKAYTKDELLISAPTEYIYVKVLDSGDYQRCPLYSDSVRVAYRGRLIPSVTYPEGYVFDQTFVGNYNVRTIGVSDNLVSGYVTGFTTALLHMHVGDRWRIFIPYDLGYGATEKTSIPAYSVLIFDVALLDIAPAGDSFYPWSSRQRQETH